MRKLRQTTNNRQQTTKVKAPHTWGRKRDSSDNCYRIHCVALKKAPQSWGQGMVGGSQQAVGRISNQWSVAGNPKPKTLNLAEIAPNNQQQTTNGIG